VFGGVGSGLYGMLLLVIIAVFVSGLMIGRTPEYLGKKIEPYEMKMAAFALMLPSMVILLFTAISVVTESGLAGIFNPGQHGFSEILYAFASQGSNNGSAFAGLNAFNNFYNIAGGIAMLFGRYWVLIPVLAIAGSMVRKKIIPKTSGTLPTDTPLFVVMIIGIVIVFGALAYLPALALGPIAEHFNLWGQYGAR
jgi:K+-transporting ATPase ATPase A chain